MNNPLVSILVPVYGVERYIERCARHLFEQTYNNIEYIFVDDCTTDNSIEILKRTLIEYPYRHNQIKIIKHTINKGLSSARNTAVAAAKGEWIIHVDSDDYIANDAIESLVNFALQNQLDVVSSQVYIVENDKTIKHPLFWGDSNKEQYIKRLLTWRHVPCSIWGRLIKRSILIKNNIRSIDGVGFAEDFAVVPIILYYARKIDYYKEKPLYYYECSNMQSFTKSEYSFKNMEDLLVAGNNIYEFYKDKNEYRSCCVKGAVSLQMTAMLQAKNLDREKLYMIEESMWYILKVSNMYDFLPWILQKVGFNKTGYIVYRFFRKMNKYSYRSSLNIVMNQDNKREQKK